MANVVENRASDSELELQIPFKSNNNNDANKDGNDAIAYELAKQQSPSKWTMMKSVIGAAIGNLLEHFDFAIFGLLVNEIGANFFPNSSANSQKLFAFAIFSGAYFIRPLGAILFGYIGDRYGRINALRVSLFMMAIPTFLTGCLPPYSSIGIFAPLCLMILRLTQGLSLGGEFSGAVTYIYEVCPPKERAFYNTLVHISGAGTIMGSLTIGALRLSFTAEQMTAFVWRIPFLFGVFVALFGVWMRKGLPHSPSFESHKTNGKLLENPVWHCMKSKKLIGTAMVIILHLMFGSASWISMFVWVPSYAVNKDINPVETIYLTNGIVMIIAIVSHVISGLMIDRFFNSNASIMVIICGSVMAVYSLFAFAMVETADTYQLMLIQLIWAFLGGFYGGGWSLWAVQRVDQTTIRYSVFGIAYNIALALFCGTAPFIDTWLVVATNATWPIGLLMFGLGCVSVSTNVAVHCYQTNDKLKNKKIENSKKYEYSQQQNMDHDYSEEKQNVYDSL